MVSVCYTLPIEGSNIPSSCKHETGTALIPGLQGDPMIVDCHQHLSPDLFPVETLVAEMDRTGIDRVALMAPICGPIPEPSATVLAALRFSLRRSWLRPLIRKTLTRFTTEGDVMLPSSVIRLRQTPDNDEVFALAEQHPDRFLAWCMVNPSSLKDPLREYERWKNHPAFVGVKAHPFWHRYPLSSLLPLCQRLAEENRPLIIHAGFDDLKDLLDLTGDLPDLKIILAHAGFPCYDHTWKAVKSRKNIAVDLSATAYVDPAIMTDVCAVLGVERCLFGTDGPFGSHGFQGGFDMGVIKTRIESVFPDKGHQRMILGVNFLTLVNRNMR